ncbi:MAG: PEGA domain-containing protein [Bacteroidales bacterium]|nr:PEGA domain-containing protein [Bacteroidales bacterium]
MKPSVKAIICLLIVWIAAMAAVPCAAQQNKISVENFSYDENETTAMAYSKRDKDNKRYALLIIENAKTGDYKFQFKNSDFVVEEKTTGGDRIYLVYVSEGANAITISNSDGSIEPLRDYRFPERIRSGKTYHLTLGEVFSAASNSSQVLEFIISPADAVVEVEGVPWDVDANGIAWKTLKFGTYSYRVTSPDYHTEAGQIVVNNPTAKQTVNVTLAPSYGYVDIIETPTLADASYYLDGQRTTLGELKNAHLSSGHHTIKITKNMYQLYEQEFDVTDSQTTTLTPVLVPNFAQTTLVADDGAEIWLNGEKIGTGSWTGPLEADTYTVECKLAGHKPTWQTVTISEVNTDKEIRLKSPTPIYGSLTISSNPHGAAIKLDGNEVGEAPVYLQNVLIGQHKVEAVYPGYDAYAMDVMVKEGVSDNVDAKLSPLPETLVAQKPQEDKKSKDDKKVKDEKKADKPESSKTKAQVSERKPFSFYVQAGAEAGSMMGADFSIGAIFHGFNLQADYTLGFQKQTLYWNFNDNLVDGAYGPDVESYKLSIVFGGRIGYQINYTDKFSLTPQVGGQYTRIKGNKYGRITSTFCTSGLIAVRAHYAINSNLGASFTPQFYFKTKAGERFDFIADPSSKIKGWGTGFTVNISLVVSF